MDWQSFAANVVGAILGSGTVATIVWLVGSSYLREKAKNVATKQDIGPITHAIEQVKAEFQRERDERRHLNELALKSVDYEHQLRLAALERKLDVHQGAYSRWSKLQSSMHGDDAWNVAVECQRWWVENNVFLTPKARAAFLDACHAVTFMVQLKDMQDPERVREWRTQVQTVLRAGNVIAEAVALPPIQLQGVEGTTPAESERW